MKYNHTADNFFPKRVEIIRALVTMIISKREMVTKEGRVNNICSERKRLSLTQSALAEKLGVSNRTLRDWENDARRVPSSAAIQMAELFGCSLDYLFGLTDERVRVGQR